MIAASHILTPDTRSIDWRQPVNWTDPLNHGLVSWWMAVPSHTAGTATWRDLCQRNDGTLTGYSNVDQAWQTQGQAGGFGALEFDGTGDRVVVPYSPSIPQSGTLSFWHRPEGSSAGHKAVIAQHNGGYPERFPTVFFHRSTTNSIKLERGAGGGYTSISYEWSNDIWVHCTVVYLDSGADVYADGQHVGTQSALSSPTSLADDVLLMSRSYSYPTYTTEGQLASVRLWDRALTADEIQDYYHRSQSYYPGVLNRHTRRSVFAPSTGTTITPATLSISAGLQGSPPVSSRTIEVT